MCEGVCYNLKNMVEERRVSYIVREEAVELITAQIKPLHDQFRVIESLRGDVMVEHDKRLCDCEAKLSKVNSFLQGQVKTVGNLSRQCKKNQEGCEKGQHQVNDKLDFLVKLINDQGEKILSEINSVKEKIIRINERVINLEEKFLTDIPILCAQVRNIENIVSK